MLRELLMNPRGCSAGHCASGWNAVHYVIRTAREQGATFPTTTFPLFGTDGTEDDS